jgi:nucleotide-binding universal stress UspA family protein
MLPIGKILCPTDFSQPSYEALDVATELAAHFSAKLLIIHVIVPVPVPQASPSGPPPAFDIASYEKQLEASSNESLDALIHERISGEVPDVQTSVLIGDAAYEITRIAEDEKVDLIVIATHGRTGWRRFLFGSVAEKVVRLASCPVLTIQASNMDKPAGR